MPQDDWKTRILPQEGIETLALGPDAFVDTRDMRYGSDAYQYFLNQQGGQSAAPGGITAATAAPVAPIAQDPTTMIPQTGGGAGITAASAVQPPISDPFLASGAAGGESLPTAPIGPTTTLPSGDVFAGGDYSDVAGTLGDPAEKMDYTQQDPTFWENAKNKFLTTGEDVGNFFNNLKDQGIDVTRMGGAAIMNMIQPGLGLAAQMIPQQTETQKQIAQRYEDYVDPITGQEITFDDL